MLRVQGAPRPGPQDVCLHCHVMSALLVDAGQALSVKKRVRLRGVFLTCCACAHCQSFLECFEGDAGLCWHTLCVMIAPLNSSCTTLPDTAAAAQQSSSGDVCVLASKRGGGGVCRVAARSHMLFCNVCAIALCSRGLKRTTPSFPPHTHQPALAGEQCHTLSATEDQPTRPCRNRQ